MIKFTEDTIMVGLITGEEFQDKNNLNLNTMKTKEMALYSSRLREYYSTHYPW